MSSLSKYTNYKTVLSVNALIWSKGKVLLIRRSPTKNVDSLPMVVDLKEYIKILAKNPNAFILGFFDHNESGELIKKLITVL